MNELPYAGAEGSVIADVLAAIKESDEITDKRILNISARSDGRVLIKTGEMRGPLSGGGQLVLLELTDGLWEISDTNLWAS